VGDHRKPTSSSNSKITSTTRHLYKPVNIRTAFRNSKCRSPDKDCQSATNQWSSFDSTTDSRARWTYCYDTP